MFFPVIIYWLFACPDGTISPGSSVKPNVA
jgi:hypothetical protein